MTSFYRSHSTSSASHAALQELEDVLILLSDKKLSSVQSVIPALEKAIAARRKLLVIAESVEGDALATLLLNRVRGTQVRFLPPLHYSIYFHIHTKSTLLLLFLCLFFLL